MARRFQSTADVEQAAARGEFAGTPRTPGWMIALCVLGGLAIAIGLILAL